MRKYIGNKAFFQEAIHVALPMMLQNLVSTCVNLIDSLMVGQLGDAAIGGVASVNRFYLIGNYGTMGIINAVGIFIAQFFGARKEKHMKESFRFSIWSAYCIIVPMFLISFFFPEFILRFFTDDIATIAQGVAYLKVAAFSFLPIGLSIAISNAMRCIGITRLPLYASVASVATNAFFNYCLIFGHFGFPEMGVVGAALATAIARFVEVFLLLLMMKYNDFPFATRIADMFDVPVELSKRITVKAIPLCANEILWSGGMAMILKLYGTRGPAVLTGYSLATTGTDIFFTLFSGMAVASTVMISQRLGANKLEEARANGYYLLGLAGMIAVVFAVLIFGISYMIPLLYTTVTDEAMQIAQNMIRIQGLLFVIYTLNTQNFFIVRAGGDTRSTLIMDSCFMWLVNIPVLALCAYFTDLSIYAIYVIGQATDLIKLAVSSAFVRKEKWVVNLVHHEEEIELEFD